MATATLVSVEEYLTTVYRPDCEYVDGVLVERNVGEWDHGRLQGVLFAFLLALEKQLGIKAAIATRVQVKPTRFRVPDLCVVIGADSSPQILTQSPFLCIEILSPEDRMTRMEERISDYLDMGVTYVWVLNPQSRRGWVYTADRIWEAKDGILKTENPGIAVSLAEIFAQF